MSKKTTKYYVVWEGKNPGIYNTWDECQEQINGFSGAKYQSFPSLELAQYAFADSYEKRKEAIIAMAKDTNDGPILPAIAVDAASDRMNRMEFRGVNIEKNVEIFHSPIYPCSNSNVGEFLAIVKGLEYIKDHKLNYALYSDSVTALAWVRNQRANVTLKYDERAALLIRDLSHAERWLLTNNYSKIPLLKWETSKWGEILADFGRK